MLREFKFFWGYNKPTLTEQWEELMQQFPTPITTYPTWTGTTYTPTWVVNPGYIVPSPYTITTTPGTGTYTIPLSGTINTATGFSLTTSNPNGTTYTTANFGGSLTTDTAFLNITTLTGTSTSSTNIK